VSVDQSVVELRSATGAASVFGLWIDDTGVVSGRFFSVGSSGNIGNTTGIFTGTTAILANEWTHLAITYDFSDVTTRLYVNGVEDASLSTPRALPTALSFILLASGGAGQFVGLMDDVIIRDVALTTFSIPEPSSLLLGMFGVMGLACSARRRRS